MGISTLHVTLVTQSMDSLTLHMTLAVQSMVILTLHMTLAIQNMVILTLHVTLVMNRCTICCCSWKQQTFKQRVFFTPSNASLWPQLAVATDRK